MTVLRRMVLLALLACGLAAAPARSQEVFDLPTRPGIRVRALVIEPADPTSVLILLSGGVGQLDIGSAGYLRRENNFLVRSRGLFTQRGHVVVLLDPPSDRSGPPYLGGNFRETPEHAADIAAVIAWARARFDKPVWIVGASRGTHSAATAALHATGAGRPDGIVLTSTILARSRFGESTARPLTELDLTGTGLPMLVVHHEQDPCNVCPPALLPELMKRLPPGTPLHTFSGGRSRGAACDPFSYHGFNGIEERVVDDISNWIRGRS
jgi:hypothetical protein